MSGLEKEQENKNCSNSDFSVCEFVQDKNALKAK